MKINNDVSAIESFLDRGLENTFPNRDFLKKRLLSGEQLSIYLGIDPTGPTLHLGHAIPLKKLGELQKMGHKIIMLIGSFTAMIGDPTDKSATRKQLTKEQVLENCKLYKKQAEVFLTFSGDNPAELKFNGDWLEKMSFADVVDLASHFTVQQMIERDMFEKRLAENKPIYLHEFLYPLMQGYDSVAMDVDGEIGGNDQTFNMLAGRNLIKEIKNKEKFVITTKLLVDTTGKKMGKSEGNMISLLDNEYDKFGKVMSWTDGMIPMAFELCTNVPMAEVQKMVEGMKNGLNPRDVKIRLAKEIVAFYHGQELADKAEKNFLDTFSKGGVSEDAEKIEVEKDSQLMDIITSKNIIASKSEFRRLIQDGAVSIVDGEKITDPNFKISQDCIIKVGKRKFLDIKVK